MRLFFLLVPILIFLLAGCNECFQKTPEFGSIELKPVNVKHPVKRAEGMKEGQELSGLVVLMKNDEMQGYAELRLPEVMHSSIGFHFLDNYSKSIQPLNELDKFPQWKTDSKTRAVYYDCRLPEGLVFGAKLTPSKNEIDIEFYVENNTGQDLDFVEVNPCFNFRKSPDFNDSWNLNKLYAYYNGQFQPMINTTPTEQQMGRKPWLLFITKGNENKRDLPRDSGTWWRVDQAAEENLLAVKSRDGQMMIGYAWREIPEYMMSNCGYPCLHSGPNFIYDLEDGYKYTYRGKIYFHDNDINSLVKRYLADRTIWNRQLQEIKNEK